MGTLRSRSYILKVSSLLLVFLLVSLWAVNPVLADVGPEPIMPAGSDLKPEEDTPVEMQAEIVTINIRKATEADNAVINFPQGYGYHFYDIWFPAIAEVEAEFTMRNPTNETVSMTVWFPLASVLEDERWEGRGGEVVPSIKRFQVLVKGKPVDYVVSELPNPQGGDSPPLPWASFPVTFPAEEKVKIKVSYLLPGQRPEAKWGGLIMEFGYIFQTGAGWAGPIGKAELVVNLPFPASPETIVEMPEGGQIDGSQVRWTWKNFEPGPADDFSISMMQPGPWQDLKAARVAIRDQPKDGQAWVDLCGTYYGLSYSGWHKNSGFGEVYPRLGLAACQEAARLLPASDPGAGQAWMGVCALYYRLSKNESLDPTAAVPACQVAARLLPGDAAPHYGLAIMYLSRLSSIPSPTDLQPVLDELKIGQELEAVQPPSGDVYYFLPLFYLDASPAEYITDWVNRIAPIPTATAKQPTRTKAPAGPTSTPHPTIPNKGTFAASYSVDDHTLLLLHLDGSYTGEQGENGTGTGTIFTAGRHSKGVLLDGRDTLTYSSAGNLDRTQGAIEFWLRPNWNGADGKDYVFFEVGKTWFNRMRIMKDGANNLRFMLRDSDTEYGVAHNVADWQAGDWHHVAVTWQDNEIALFVDGRKEDSSRNAHLPDELDSKIAIGSLSAERTSQANAVIDELRISDVPRLGDIEFIYRMPQPSPTTASTTQTSARQTSEVSEIPRGMGAFANAPTPTPPATSVPQGTRTGSLPLIAVAGVILMISAVYLILKRRV